ncbi:hypothetical protein K7711_31900 [Nocardia sp. CA2R105]|uniref:hypothetical protein n=1 Tax=Nocardia coffeae TaxID=2873381 RepID=UPI001CA64A5E|nr:hypothetical protein [Nocardia coffeae]MBY8861118.1 hypothetical protein [Nocardia coffeae]
MTLKNNRDQATGIRLRPDLMWFDELPHTAELSERGWRVSWLPDREDLSHQQARDALAVAKMSTSYRMREFARRDWPQIKKLALGLNVDPRDAVKLVRDAEAHARDQAIETPRSQLPHLAASTPSRPQMPERVIRVDAPTPPEVRTPGRVPGQWLGSGEFLDRGVER